MPPVDFTAYGIGLCYASACSSLPPKEVEERMNNANPTGISSPWKLSEEATFRGGQPNPCVCEDHPATHKHYLLSC